MVGALPRPRYCFGGPPRMAGLQRSDVQHVFEHEDLSDRHVCCSDRGIFECLPKQQPSVTVAAVRCGVWSQRMLVFICPQSTNPCMQCRLVPVSLL